jgi:hypothetical protein
MREKLRSAKELPMQDTSITESEKSEPSLAKPSTATEDPIRAQLLSDREAPKWNKSKTDTVAPKRLQP